MIKCHLYLNLKEPVFFDVQILYSHFSYMLKYCRTRFLQCSEHAKPVSSDFKSNGANFICCSNLLQQCLIEVQIVFVVSQIVRFCFFEDKTVYNQFTLTFKSCMVNFFDVQQYLFIKFSSTLKICRGRFLRYSKLLETVFFAVQIFVAQFRLMFKSCTACLLKDSNIAETVAFVVHILQSEFSLMLKFLQHVYFDV